jgi:pimeloyl-ACP methyl ester carboxylesterase
MNNKAYYIANETSDPALPLIIALHGAGASSESMIHCLRAFERLARVKALNFPGSGRSGGRAINHIQPLAAYAAGFIAGENSRPWLLGHSLGSAVALQLAGSWPQLLSGLILLNPALSMPLSPAFMARLQSDTAATMPAFLHKAYGPLAPAQWQEEALAIVARMAPETVISDFQACRSYETTSACLAAINLPCLILSAQDDQLNSPADGRAMAELMPDCRLTLIPQAGHMLPRQKPELVAAESSRFIAGRK